jgi:hypothetical protein
MYSTAHAIESIWSVRTAISSEIERIFSPIIVTAIGDLSSKLVGTIRLDEANYHHCRLKSRLGYNEWVSVLLRVRRDLRSLHRCTHQLESQIPRLEWH